MVGLSSKRCIGHMKLNMCLTVNKAYILSFVNQFSSTLTNIFYFVDACIALASFRNKIRCYIRPCYILPFVQFNYNGITVGGRHTIANTFNEYCTNTGPELTKQTDTPRGVSVFDYLITRINAMNVLCF